MISDSTSPSINLSSVQPHEWDTMSRILIRSVTQAFKDPSFAAEYEMWREKQREEAIL